MGLANCSMGDNLHKMPIPILCRTKHINENIEKMFSIYKCYHMLEKGPEGGKFFPLCVVPSRKGEKYFYTSYFPWRYSHSP